MQLSKPVQWNTEKNELLKKDRGISFEDVVEAIAKGKLLNVVPHPNHKRYPHQRMFIVIIREYVYDAPFVEDNTKIFLKTIIPNSDRTKEYLSK